MESKKWLELIEKKESEIMQVGIEAYRDSLHNPELQFVVELTEDGDVCSWYGLAGNDCQSSTSFNGTSIEMYRVCNQCWEGAMEISEEQVIEKLRECYSENQINELQVEARECHQSLASALEDYDDDMYDVVIGKLKDEYIAWMVDECGYGDVERGIEETKDRL
jgi:hypothetical protein